LNIVADIDRIKPTFSSGSILSSVAGYNSTSPKLNISASDNYTATNQLKMCTSYDRDSCPKDVTNAAFVNYDAGKVLGAIQANHDGSNHTVYVTVSDRAGNYVTNHYSYTLAITVSYNANGGTGTMAPTYCNKQATCTISANTFTRSNYDYQGWYTAATGGSKYTRNTATFNQNATLYAHWKKNDCWTTPVWCTSQSNANSYCGGSGCYITVRTGNSCWNGGDPDRYYFDCHCPC